MVEEQATSQRLLQLGLSPKISGHRAFCQSGPFMVSLPPSGKLENRQALAIWLFQDRDTGEI